MVPHNPVVLLGLILSLALCVYIFWASMCYFLYVKAVWRWIKLAYAFNACIVAITIIGDLFGLFVVSEEVLVLLSLALLSTIASGLIVAQAKLDLIKRLPHESDD